MLRSIRLHAAVLGLAITAPVHSQETAPVSSHIIIMNLNGTPRREIYSAPRRIEAPNWSPDGKYLLWNSEGKLLKFSLAGGEPEAVDNGTIRGINNDHG